MNINLDNVFASKEAKKRESADSALEPKSQKRRKSALLELSPRYEYRRAFSETKLLDLMSEFKWEDGKCYNFITAGDIDSLSYLKGIIRAQNLEYVLCSTWCMAGEDILQIKEWLKEGRLKKVDFYVGEIFPTSYVMEYAAIQELIRETNCGRCAVFRNHSKIFAGYGDKFSFGVQSSANINTNPRTEQASITIGGGIYEFYKEYFDGINSIH